MTYIEKKDFSEEKLDYVDIQSARVEQKRCDSAPLKSIKVWAGLEILL